MVRVARRRIGNGGGLQRGRRVFSVLRPCIRPAVPTAAAGVAARGRRRREGSLVGRVVAIVGRVVAIVGRVVAEEGLVE